MATPPERIDDLDLHLNPPAKPPLDFLAEQELRPEPEPSSGIHDFSEVKGKKPMENLDLSAIPPLASVVGNESNPESEKKEEETKEEIFPLSQKLVSYINSLPEGVPKKSLLHSIEDMPKSAMIRTLGNYHTEHYLTEEEYNTILGLINDSDKKEEELDPRDFMWPPPPEDTDNMEVINLLTPKNTLPASHEEQTNHSIENSEKEEIIKNTLDIARENYARAKIEFSKKNNNYNKIKSSLHGLLSKAILFGRSEKSPTEVELEEAQMSLDEALSAYINEKKVKKDEIISDFETEVKEKNGDSLSPEKQREIIGQIKIKLLEQAEKEWDLLQGQIEELSLPEGERMKKIKEITVKGLKIWSKVPMAVRLTLAPILIGTGVGLTAGLGAGALYAGTRLGRGLGGAVGSRVAGGLYGKRADRINAEAHEETVSSYTDENDGKSFEEREGAYMRAREEEIKRKNSQRIKKAMVMVGAGAGAGILTGLAESTLSSGGAMGGTSSTEVVNKPKISATSRAYSFDGVIKPKTPEGPVSEIISGQKEVVASGLDTVKAPIAPISTPITVELSSKGFLQDIHNLKANIIKQYGDNIPEEIKTKIINKPTIEIAKEYGFYKPGDAGGDSALGYKGDSLSVDSNGHLVYEHEGKSNLMFDAQSGKIKPFEGKTFSPKMETVEAPATPNTFVDQGEVVPAKNMELESNVAVEKVVIPDEPEIVPAVDTAQPDNLVNQIPYKNSLINIINEGDGKVVKIGEQTIAHERVFADGKILVLDDIYQEDSKYRDFREAFVLAFEKSAKIEQIGQRPTGIEFEGGKIYVIQGLKNDPMGMKVLLNGKEIASGSMEIKGSVLGPKLKFDSSLKGGWFLDDNVYERAFKYLKKSLSIK